MNKITPWLLAIALTIGISFPTQARYYDAGAGRFITPDTIVQSPYDPQTLNRYAYVRNNPLIYIDPDGHSFFGDIGNFFSHLTINKAAEVVFPVAWATNTLALNTWTSHRTQFVNSTENYFKNFSLNDAAMLANPIFWASSTPMGWKYEKTHPNQVRYAATAALIAGTYGAGFEAGAFADAAEEGSTAASLWGEANILANGAAFGEASGVAFSALAINSNGLTIQSISGRQSFDTALRAAPWGAVSAGVENQILGYNGITHWQAVGANALAGASIARIRNNPVTFGAAGGALSAEYDWER